MPNSEILFQNNTMHIISIQASAWSLLETSFFFRFFIEFIPCRMLGTLRVELYNQ